MTDKKGKKGFSGLSDLVSEIHLEEESNNSECHRVGEQLKPKQQSKPEIYGDEHKLVPKQKSTPSTSGAKQERDNSSGGSGVKWLFGIISVVLVIWLIDNGSQTNKNPSYTAPTYSKPQSSPTPTTKTPSPPIAAAQPPSSNQSIKLLYIMPPVGTDTVFSVAQIRWCLRESIRIDTMREVMDTYEGIDTFNSIINNFNDRCGRYRYRQGMKAQAERDVEPNRSNIITEALIDAREISPSQFFSTAPPPSRTSTKPNAQFTKEAQQLLMSLGYDPGPVDGDYGRRTGDLQPSCPNSCV